jgi:hypothetical protein
MTPMAQIRLQIDITEERLREIERLMDECGFSSKKEFFDNAVTLLKWAVRRSKEGNLIASVNEQENKWRELQMPFLVRAHERARRTVG